MKRMLTNAVTVVVTVTAFVVMIGLWLLADGLATRASLWFTDVIFGP